MGVRYLAMSMIHVSGSGCGWLWSCWGHRKVRIVDQEEEEVCNMTLYICTLIPTNAPYVNKMTTTPRV